MIKNFEPRLYQQTILGTAAHKNTLVVLPTGLGKTAVAFLLAAQRLHLYPKSKILMLAPTKPLCEQHVTSFQKHLQVPEENIVLFTGSVKPEKREQLWKQAQVIISTPQGLENDAINKRVNLKEVSLLVFDESHHATGDYAYVWLAKHYQQICSFPRILALTASPGSDLEKIQEVCQNLHIEKVEVRTEQDADVKPYIQTIKKNWVKVDFPPEFEKIRKFLKDCRQSKLLETQRYGYLNKTDLHKGELLKLQGQLQREISKGVREFELLRSISLVAEALKVEHAIELLESQGLQPLETYLTNIQNQAQTSKVKAVQNLSIDANFKSAAYLTSELINKKIIHPKLTKLQEIIGKAITNDSQAKVIIFTQFRDSAEQIVKTLDVLNVKNHIFFGQAKKNGKCFSQKQQKEILDKFRAGEFNVLVATSVAEEGLDIPKVDKVLFYEPVPSAIRTIQRCLPGRTKILCSNGLYKEIKNIKKGEIVLSINEKTLKLEPKEVTNTFNNGKKNIIHFSLIDGSDISLSKEHPVFTRKGWVPAERILVGEEIAVINKVDIKNSEVSFFDLLPDKTYLFGCNKIFKNLKENSRLMFKEIAEKLKNNGLKTNTKNLFGYSKNKAIPLPLLKQVANLSKVSLKELLGDNFIVKSKYGKKLELFSNNFLDFMWLVGLIATDGNLRTEISQKWKNTICHRARITNKNKRIIQKACRIFKKLGIKTHVSLDKLGIYRVEVANLIFGEMLLKLGIKNKNKTYLIKADDFIYKMSSTQIFSYLAGIFDGDGNYNNNSKNYQQQIRIGTASKKFAIDIKNLLLRLGIPSKIIYSFRNETRIIHGKEAVFNCHFYSVEFYRGSQVNKFLSSGFVVKKKFRTGKFTGTQKRLSRIKGDIIWTRVIKRNKINKTVQTYNLRVKDNDNYIAENVVLHNCGRTGRLEEGAVTILLTANTRDEAYRWSAHHKEKRMYKNLEKLKDGFSFLQEKEQTLHKYIPKEQVVAILADHREKDNKVVKDLIDLGISVKTAQLETADYILSGKVGVELKKIPDFVASIIDGRLLEQVRDLSKNFDKAVLIIEGEEDIYAIRKVHANAIRGMLSSIVLDFQVPILYTKNTHDTASLLAVMAKREQNKDSDFTYHPSKPKSTKQQLEFVISSFPTIGTNTAKILLKEFQTIQNIVNATEEELESVKGIGKKTAEKIKKISKEIY